MPTLTKFYSFVEAIHEKKHNLGSDTLKVLLTNTAPSLSNTQKSDISGELSTASGYTAGGATVTITSSAQSSGLYTLIATDVTWTASGGSIGPFRYAVFYNDTATNDELIGYLDYGYSVTVASGQTFTLDFDAVSGLYYAS
jgi:hypothetical protein